MNKNNDKQKSQKSKDNSDLSSILRENIRYSLKLIRELLNKFDEFGI